MSSTLPEIDLVRCTILNIFADDELESRMLRFSRAIASIVFALFLLIFAVDSALIPADKNQNINWCQPHAAGPLLLGGEPQSTSHWLYGRYRVPMNGGSSTAPKIVAEVASVRTTESASREVGNARSFCCVSARTLGQGHEVFIAKKCNTRLLLCQRDRFSDTAASRVCTTTRGRRDPGELPWIEVFSGPRVTSKKAHRLSYYVSLATQADVTLHFKAYP